MRSWLVIIGSVVIALGSIFGYFSMISNSEIAPWFFLLIIGIGALTVILGLSIPSRFGWLGGVAGATPLIVFVIMISVILFTPPQIQYANTITSTYTAGQAIDQTFTVSFTTVSDTPYVILNSSSTARASCAISSEGSLILTILTDNSTTGASSANSGPVSPVRSLPVQVGYYLSSNCYPFSDFAPSEGIGARSTNSSGMLVVCCMVGNYYLNFSYGGRGYFQTAYVQPEKATCLTMYVPSGRVQITYSQTFSSACG